VFAVLAVSGSICLGQKPTEEPPGCLSLPDGSVCKVRYPNGVVMQTLVDGSTWATVRANQDDQLSVQVNKAMPAEGVFWTNIIQNEPESDILNGPKSEKIQIQGDCQTRTYEIMGGLLLSEKNGLGVPMGDWEMDGVLRRVIPDTSIAHVFKMVCKQPLTGN
jgi:hypothetical protein